MFKHQPATVDACAVRAVSPIRIHSVEFATAAALFRMEVVAFIIRVDSSPASVTPDDKQVSRFWVDFSAHL